MANTDIMGLLTGVSRQGINPMSLSSLSPSPSSSVGLSGGFRERMLQRGAQRAERLGGAVRGMLSGGPTAQEKIIQAAWRKQREDEQKRLTQLENLARALPAEYASLATAIRNGVEGSVQKGVEVLAREKQKPKVETETVNIQIDGVNKKALIDKQSGDVIKTFDVEEDRDMIEEVDPATGQTLNYSIKKDGTDKVLIGVKSLPEYDMVKQDDGTYTVLNKTTAGVVQENVPTAESANIAKQKYAKTVQTLHEIDRQIGFIDESKRLTNEYIAFLYPLAKYVPTSDSRQQKAMVESLQSNLAMDKLMELKRNSTTGASGLGALNQAELIMLQDALGKLDPAAGDEAFKRQLDLVKKHYMRFRQTLMGITPQIDWENPEYSKFTRTVTDAYGEERKFYFLSDEFGQPQTDPQTGEIQWYEVPRVTIK